MKIEKWTRIQSLIVVMWAALLFIGCNDDDTVYQTTDNVLQIGLATGFSDDHISVTVNYRTVLDESVSTDMTVDMADTTSGSQP